MILLKVCICSNLAKANTFYWYLMPFTILFLVFLFYLTYFFKTLDFRKSFFIYANGVAWYIKNIRMNKILLYDIWVQCYNLSNLHILWQSAVSMQISMCPVLYQSNSMLNAFLEIICIKIYTYVFYSYSKKIVLFCFKTRSL